MGGGWLVTTAPSALLHVCEDVILVLSGAGRMGIAISLAAFRATAVSVRKEIFVFSSGNSRRQQNLNL